MDGRSPYADLAAATGWSETTVRRRVDQLRDARALYFDLELDMPAFGFRSTVWMWLSVPPSQLAAVGTALAKFPEVAYAIATTGPANLAACAVCRSQEELYAFLTDKVGALPGRGAHGDGAGYPHGQAGFPDRGARQELKTTAICPNGPCIALVRSGSLSYPGRRSPRCWPARGSPLGWSASRWAGQR